MSTPAVSAVIRKRKVSVFSLYLCVNGVFESRINVYSVLVAK